VKYNDDNKSYESFELVDLSIYDRELSIEVESLPH